MTTPAIRITRLTAERWGRLSIPQRWLVLCRAPVLLLTLQVVVLAGLFACSIDEPDPALWLLCLTALVLAHATNNLLNDYVDYQREIDDKTYFRLQYGSHPLAEGFIAPAEFWIYCGTTGFTALALAGVSVALSGLPALVPAILGAFFLLFYTWPLKTLGLGELAVYLCWGPAMMTGTGYVITGTWSTGMLLFSLVAGLGPALVIFGKHIDKCEQDSARAVGTLPVRIGESRARWLVIVMAALMFAGLSLLVIAGHMPVWSALCVLSAPAARTLVIQCLKPRPSVPPAVENAPYWPLWYSVSAFNFNIQFGFWLGIGLAIDLI